MSEGSQVIVGVDPGQRRTGIAFADQRTNLAQPLSVVDANDSDPVDAVVEIAEQRNAALIVVGRPTSLSGRAGPAVDAQQRFIARLRARTEIPIVEFDERFSTVIAAQGLRAGGGRKKDHRNQVDAVAAQVMLQGYLDTHER